MNLMQPIRDVEKINEIKAYLLRQCYRNYFLFVLGINTGLRISDIIVLKVLDVKYSGHIILIEDKTEKEKRFFINDELREEINRYTKGMSDNDYLFPSREGGYIKRHRAYSIIKEACNASGLKEVGAYTMRKTFGYHFYQRKKDIVALQKIFQHDSPSYTLRYIGIEQDQIDETLRDFNL